jgi:hypothetical protein
MQNSAIDKLSQIGESRTSSYTNGGRSAMGEISGTIRSYGTDRTQDLFAHSIGENIIHSHASS